jgi:branched-chain amino acid aminotransferase
LGGITRGNIIRVCREAGIPVYEKRFSLFDVYSADEAFLTGTFAGVSPIREVDGRQIAQLNGPVSQRISTLYKELVQRSLTPIA